jgi:voltage-gated potassium channel
MARHSGRLRLPALPGPGLQEAPVQAVCHSAEQRMSSSALPGLQPGDELITRNQIVQSTKTMAAPSADAQADTCRRKRVFQILELARPDDRISRWFDIFIVLFISINILAIILGSVGSLYSRYEHLFFRFEILSVAVFTIEYLLRVWSSVEHPGGDYAQPLAGRLRFSLTPMALVDLMAFLPFYLGMFFSLDLRFLRVLRLVRIFKLTRYSSAMSMLLNVLQDEARAFGAAFFILVVIMTFAASGIYLFEHEVQPDAFGSIPAAIWWAVATLTTVGYGDVTPVTVGGKVFGSTIMIIGVGMVALPAGILASAFSEQVRLRREQYEDLAEEALGDGIITAQEQLEMERTRIELGLSAEDAGQIFARIAKEEIHRKGVCPHCRKPLQNRRQGD